MHRTTKMLGIAVLLGIAGATAMGAHRPALAQTSAKTLAVNTGAAGAVLHIDTTISGNYRVNIYGNGNNCTIMTANADDALALLTQLQSPKVTAISCRDSQNSPNSAFVHNPVQATESYQIISSP